MKMEPCFGATQHATHSRNNHESTTILTHSVVIQSDSSCYTPVHKETAYKESLPQEQGLCLPSTDAERRSQGLPEAVPLVEDAAEQAAHVLVPRHDADPQVHPLGPQNPRRRESEELHRRRGRGIAQHSVRLQASTEESA